MADVYRAIADETRRLILDALLQRDEQTLFELCTTLAMAHDLTPSRQAVSQHLDVLESAGLVRTERRGRYKLHTIDTTPLAEIAERWPIGKAQQ
jgi:DNA-binding transcriptional ArsR family regulator